MHVESKKHELCYKNVGVNGRGDGCLSTRCSNELVLQNAGRIADKSAMSIKLFSNAAQPNTPALAAGIGTAGKGGATTTEAGFGATISGRANVALLSL